MPPIHTEKEAAASEWSPVHYVLEWEVDPLAVTFTGCANITWTRRAAGKSSDGRWNVIGFHAVGLVWTGDAKLEARDGEGRVRTATSPLVDAMPPPPAKKCNDPYHRAVRLPPTWTDVTRVVVELRYTAPIGSQMYGLYRSRLDDTSCVVSTQFEPTGARTAFPCRDDPVSKAVFEMTLRVPGNYEAHANTDPPVAVVKNDNGRVAGWREWTFAPTPVMSPYLVCVCIAPWFDAIEADTPDGTVRVSVLQPTPSRPDAKDKSDPEEDSFDFPNSSPDSLAIRGAFALDVAVRCLEWYAQYFGHPYALPQLRLVALPQFAAGAMENWGLVTFRSSLLLLPKPSPHDDNAAEWAGRRQAIAEIVAHELAHQWVGNLVTARTWRDLWLNEGMATFFSAKCLAELEPQEHPWSEFLRSTRARAMEGDDVPGSASVRGPDRRFDRVVDAHDAFDPRTTYARGALVCALLEQRMRPEHFQASIRRYIQGHLYATATTDGFLQCVEDVSQREVARLWLERPHHPLLVFQLTPPQRHYGCRVQQALTSTVRTVFPIQFQLHADGSLWQFDWPWQQPGHTIRMVGPETWAAADQVRPVADTSPYLFRSIVLGADASLQIHTVTQLHDAFSVDRNADTSGRYFATRALLRAAHAFLHEHPQHWRAVRDWYTLVDRLVRGASEWRQYVRECARAVAVSQPAAVAWQLDADDPAALARIQPGEWPSEEDSAEVRSAALRAALRHDWTHAWRDTWRRYRQDDGANAYRLLCALCESRHLVHLHRLLSRTIGRPYAGNIGDRACASVSAAGAGRCHHCGDDDSSAAPWMHAVVRKDDLLACFRCMARTSSASCRTAWQFVRAHWSALVQRVGDAPHILSTAVGDLVAHLDDGPDGPDGPADGTDDDPGTWLRRHLSSGGSLPSSLRQQCRAGIQRREWSRRLIPEARAFAVEYFSSHPSHS